MVSLHAYIQAFTSLNIVSVVSVDDILTMPGRILHPYIREPVNFLWRITI